MKQKYLYIAVLMFGLVSCSKDKLQSTPTLKLKSVSSTEVFSGGTLVVSLDFTDKEGDISNTIYVEKIRKNLRTVPTIRDTFSLTIGDYPKNPRGVLALNLEYGNYLVSAINPPKVSDNPPLYENDTLVIRFALRDLAGNVSDTVTTPTIVVNRN